MLLTVDRGNIPQVASDKRHWPCHRGILQDTAACSAPVVATRVCVCVCARLLGIRVQETQWPIVCLLAFQLASGLAWLHAFTCAACFAFWEMRSCWRGPAARATARQGSLRPQRWLSICESCRDLVRDNLRAAQHQAYLPPDGAPCAIDACLFSIF